MAENLVMKLILLSVLLFFTLTSYAQELTAEQLLARSIEFHDPMGKWETAEMELILKMETPNQTQRVSKVNINNAAGTFSVEYVSKGHLLNYQVQTNDSVEVWVDFQKATGRTDIDSLDLSPDRARRWRNYYSYLYGLPMKLKDAGTNINQEVRNDYFNGQSALSIRVTYDEAVGGDIWYFYFHPETYAMVGYRFYHDENINDGEYILLDGMEIQNGMRIPKDRYWYVNEDASFLGADMLQRLSINN